MTTVTSDNSDNRENSDNSDNSGNGDNSGNSDTTTDSDNRGKAGKFLEACCSRVDMFSSISH